ncbi:hypothetical protein [Thiomonas sp. FB-Cd]|uniref:hypothetical protein n=1 Tax=Thiomonas sp. FB-Cd TaxID=1158292 RepID=UPI0004DEF14E|nr:hypothetical protein [Thiomonas sp. FB-Cd]
MDSDTESRLRITEGDGFGRIRPVQVADGSGADAKRERVDSDTVHPAVGPEGDKRCLPLPQLEVR